MTRNANTAGNAPCRLATPSRRRDKRQVVQRRVFVRLPSQRIVDATSHNLSMGGLALRMPTASAMLVLDPDRRARRLQDTIFEFRMGLPGGHELLELNGRAVAVYTQPTGAGEALVGMQFERMETVMRQRLAAFIAGTTHRAG